MIRDSNFKKLTPKKAAVALIYAQLLQLLEGYWLEGYDLDVPRLTSLETKLIQEQLDAITTRFERQHNLISK